MEVTLEGSNSAETLPPWDGVAGGHLPVTGKLAVWLDNRNSLLFAFFLSTSVCPASITTIRPHSLFIFIAFDT
jgi:hypothetical protein